MSDVEKIIASEEVIKFLSKAGFKGGKSTSALKVAACRKNGVMPCKDGKKRGRPFGMRLKKPAAGEVV